MRASRRAVVGAVLAFAAGGLVACAPPQVDQARCANLEQRSVLETLASRLDERRAGSFRNAVVVQSVHRGGGVWLVSAELLREGDDEDTPGDIYTFATGGDPNAGAADYVAIDPNARDYSAWPHDDDLNVKVDGAIESRACVAELRGPRGNRGILGG